jgi:hypothetical protein
MVLLLAVFPAHARQDNALASLEPVQGLVQILTDSGDWETVTDTILVSEGDSIRTSGDGMAYLTFFDGIETEIGASTLVVVSTMDLPEDGPVNVTLDVLVGNTLTNIDVALDAVDRFEIHTPGATAVVRGTRWWTIVEPDGSASFVTERGEVQIVPHIRRPVVTGSVVQATSEAVFVPEEGAAPMAAAPVELMVTAGTSMRADRSGAMMSVDLNIQTPRRPLRVPLAERSCGDGICTRRERSTCALDCMEPDDLPNCGNGLCEADQGEDLLVCGADCGPWAGESCGNGTCDADESGLTCAADCALNEYFDPVDPSMCGNEICEMTESAMTCPGDCELAP